MFTRSAFLGTAAASGLLAATQATAAAAPGAPPEVRPDIAAFQAVIAKRYKHKQVAAAVNLRNGAFLQYMTNTLNAYEFAWNEGPGTTHVAAVLYGPSIAAVLSDAMWDEYKLGDVVTARFNDSVVAEGHTSVNPFVQFASDVVVKFQDALGGNRFTANPFLRDPSTLPATGNKSDALYKSNTVTALQLRGASFFVCNNALKGLAQIVISSKDEARVEAVRARMAQNFVGGAMLVPAGVAAVNACQENEFTYLNGNAV